MREAYHNSHSKQDLSEEQRPRYRGVSYVKPITAAKEAISVIDLADRLCGPGQLRRVGGHWTARCPLPDHEDRVPSFVVYEQSNSWYCFSCLMGGDVVELYRLANGYAQSEAHVAAGYLLLEFGVDLPERPPSWSAKQKRQRKVREAIEAERIEHIRMLVFRLVWIPWLKTLPELTRKDAKRSTWESSYKIAKLLYSSRRAS